MRVYLTRFLEGHYKEAECKKLVRVFFHESKDNFNKVSLELFGMPLIELVKDKSFLEWRARYEHALYSDDISMGKTVYISDDEDYETENKQLKKKMNN